MKRFIVAFLGAIVFAGAFSVGGDAVKHAVIFSLIFFQILYSSKISG
jgi:hypothetical protein